MIKLVNEIHLANAITHAGSFHADDIFSTIFLSRFQDVFLYRTNEIPEDVDLSSKIVFDIGYGAYDHHGVNAKIRDNGVKYSSFGLLFEAYGKEYLKQRNVCLIEEAYQMFLQEFVLQIDAIDNGIFPSNPKDYKVSSLSLVMELFNKTWKEELSNEEAFLNAIHVGELIFERIERRILDKLTAKEFVHQAILKSQDSILILDQYMPFMDYVLEHKDASSLLFCIYPSNRGGFHIQTILKDKESHENRKNFPKEWGGKSSMELKALTGIETFHFCHFNLFLCASDTLEDAIQIAKFAINEK